MNRSGQEGCVMPLGLYATAKVYILDNPFSIDRPYTYYIPSDMKGDVEKGAFVTVPFGKGNRKQMGVVTEVCPPEDAEGWLSDYDVKPITALCAERWRLDEEQLSLCFYLKEQTLCTLGEAVRTVVPAAVMAKLMEYYRALPPEASGLPGSLTTGELMVYDYIPKDHPISLQSIKHHFGAQAQTAVDRLSTLGLIRKEMVLKQPEPPTEEVYCLACSRDEAEKILDGQSADYKKLSSEKQKAVIRALLEGEREMPRKALCEASGSSKPQFDALVQKGILKSSTVVQLPPVLGLPPMCGKGSRIPHALSDEQAEALSVLKELAHSGEAKAALLHGVTGSGKTCVMLEMIDDMLDHGKGVIVLLPEISLTPQMLSIFCARYGEQVAVIHSALSAGERQASHLRILSGDARVVIGTRSAVFAPVQNLGMMIMDEEQEHTYKSDMNPKYHARDIARYRCATHKALLLLASATPSLESYQKAKEGKYTLITMKKRYGRGGLPRVEIVDMRGESLLGNTSPLSHRLTEMLVETFGQDRQSVLFLNRRGYSTRLVCRSCGKAVTCPRCSVAMNYHTKKGDYTDGELICHWCGTRRRVPTDCPECGSPHLVRMGYGTQRVEQELGDLMPDAKIMRMDADTTATKTAYHDLLGSFRNREADILLGTQMVTKGHDFPYVTLVGVMLADASLYLDDYRAAERTFSMLTQVIGRAGRGDTQGLAVIQTMNPDHDVIKLACRQDYETFFESEIKLRRLLVFPPFCDIVLLTLTSPDEKELQKAALRLAEELSGQCKESFSDVPVVAFGPFEAPVYRVDSVYRMRMVVKCRFNKRARALFATLLCSFAGGHQGSRRPTLSVDFNPSGI
ncbi:MAG: primosomal protein N' [Ruminococcaceae bacterium]|nr:primosomal protein N' [Oscillospiraceae bacterium]